MWRQASAGRPHYRLAQGQLDFLDEVRFTPGGGRYGQGYIYATARVDPRAWFFGCHFYQDPVMPGSLGVEAMVQAMQAYALRQDLGRGFRSPRFEPAADHGVTWKYRGQLTPGNEALALEIHLREPENRPEGLVLSGDASLWKDGLRIYAVDGVAIQLAEA
jgi:3-hydroxymyristoyl/3-hydroxydecanoyl-(acyl carrier protein) dehydratase